MRISMNEAPKLTNEISSLVFQFVSVKDSLVKCFISRRDHRQLEHSFFRCTELWASKNLCWHNDSPQTVGCTENVPKKINS